MKMSDDRVAAAWRRIERALDQLKPGTTSTLGRGATDAEILELETQLGFALPRDVRASLGHHAKTSDQVLYGILSPNEIAREYARDDVWPRYRVPLAGEGGHYAVEMRAAGAPVDRIVWRWRDGSVEKRAESWAELLEKEAELIESGSVTVEAGVVVRPEAQSRPSGLELDTSSRFISQVPQAPSVEDPEPVIEHNTLVPPK